MLQKYVINVELKDHYSCIKDPQWPLLVKIQTYLKYFEQYNNSMDSKLSIALMYILHYINFKLKNK